VIGIFAPDCDCDGQDTIGMLPIRIRRYATDREACARYVQLGPEYLHTEALHGPSGHLLAIRPAP